MKVLVTGGAGFIGSHVVEAYLGSGYEVIVVDNLSSGNLQNLPGDVKFYLLDICSPELEKIYEIEKPDFVNHHAAQISVSLSTRNPILDSRINSQGLLNILENSVRYHIKKFIFISTGGAIYGEADVMPTAEDYPPQPLSPYGIHKYLGEHYLRFYAQQYGLSYTVLRYANVYGPRQNPHGEAGVVAIFFDQLLNDKTPTIYSYPEDQDGMVRDYVYVEDIARANLPATDKGTGEVINIGTGIPTTTGSLYREISGTLKVNREPKRGKPRAGDLRKSCLDITKAKRILDWTPSMNLHEGISKTELFFAQKR
ncbi:MAG: NAD-dependent epimerase/dehydratase family protein [Spirochaeta sp.]|nr:NAD-dependent epimerase/dehydratase family protein [Spirochaeta sp.]